MRWSAYWTGALARRLIRRLLAGDGGDALQPRWLPRRWVTVVSGDVDRDAGAGVLWLVSRPGRENGAEYTVGFERCGEEWKQTGGGSSSGGRAMEVPRRLAAGSTGQLGMIELGGSGGRLSHAYLLRHPDGWMSAPWVGYVTLQVAAEVDHLVVGERRIEVPANGTLVVAWKSPPSTVRGGVRPRIAAIGADGAELAVLGPRDHMDSHTWAKVLGGLAPERPTAGERPLVRRAGEQIRRGLGQRGRAVARRVQDHHHAVVRGRVDVGAAAGRGGEPLHPGQQVAEAAGGGPDLPHQGVRAGGVRPGAGRRRHHGDGA